MTASARSQISAFRALAINAEANALEASGKSITHCEIGQPARDAPQAVRDAALAALTDAPQGYTEAAGRPKLREGIARWYMDQYGVDVAPHRIMLTAGSSPALVTAFLTAFDAGARVGWQMPGYAAYRNTLAALDIEPVGIPAREESEFRLTIGKLEAISPALDGLILASPANPTGTMLPAEDLSALCRWCEDEAGIRLISDEVYHGLNYDMQPETALAHAPSAIVTSGFSKYFAMTGWRLGWAVVPDDLCDPFERLLQNLFVAPPTLAQHAALAALDCKEELDGYADDYRANRDMLLRMLPAMGFTDIAPADGAFYLFVETSHLHENSEQLAADWLHSTGLAVTPGTDFDPDQGHRFIRMSYAGSREDMANAIEALATWLDSNASVIR
ncbi:MAG: aminotransferase class I/II-fold pyridoxal phosphate-dependent enzyme [Alphaproteobacteria bacterium]